MNYLTIVMSMKRSTFINLVPLVYFILLTAIVVVGCHPKQPNPTTTNSPPSALPPLPVVVVLPAPPAVTPSTVVTAVNAPIEYQKNQDPTYIVAVWKQVQVANDAAKFFDDNGAIRFSMLKFADSIAVINSSHCPQDFQDAFAKLVKSATELGTHDHALAFTSGFLEDGAKSEAQAVHNSQVEEFQSNVIECKRVAAQHSAVLSQ